MFCKECGVETPEGALFCPICGEELAKQESDPGDVAATEETGAEIVNTPDSHVTSTPSPPSSLPTPIPQPVDAAAGSVRGVVHDSVASPVSSGPAMNSAQPPVEQPAAYAASPQPPAPAQMQTSGQIPVAQTPAQGPPPASGKKTGTTCLIIGCVVIFLFTIFGAVGFGIFSYIRSSNVEISSEQIPPQTVVPDEASATDEEYAPEGQTEATSAESDVNASSRALHTFLIALENGNTAAIRAGIAGDSLSSFDPDLWGQGDAQHLDFDVTDTQPDGSGGWTYSIKETMRDIADGTEYTDNYDITLSKINGEWLVTEFGDMQ